MVEDDEAAVVEASMSSPEVTSLPDKCQSLRQRSIRKRIETERNAHLPKQRKQRERPAPLSKYREDDDRMNGFRVKRHRSNST